MCEHEVSRERVAYLTAEVARLTRENAALEARLLVPWRVCPRCLGGTRLLVPWRVCPRCAGVGTVPPEEEVSDE